MKILERYKYIYETNLHNLSFKNRLIIGFRLVRRRLFRMKFPISMMIGLTYRCQYSCPHCCIGGYSVQKERELTTDKITSLIDQAIKLGICKVRFFGGEPLLREDIFQLTRYASQKGLIVSMDSNGRLLTGGVADSLKQSGMCEVDISVDSCRPEIHDRLRGEKDSYRLAIDAARYCIERGIAVILSTYITRDSIERNDLKGIIELGKRLGASGVKVLFPVASGKWHNNLKEILSNDEKQYILNFLDSSFVFFEGQGNYDSRSCSMLKKEIFYISPYGDLQPCCFIPLIFGNIHNNKLEEIWKKMSKSPFYEEGYFPCVMNDGKFRQKYLACRAD